MPLDHPQTPESPSQISSVATDFYAKSSSPHFAHSLPTPAHSINGSMSLASDLLNECAPHDDSSNKRKRDLRDNGDRDQKKLHVEDSRFSIDDIHLDVGEKYLLCKTPHPGQQPALTQDLFELYALHGIAESVARFTPDGHKNPLRKTYKKYIKTLGLSGAFDVGKKEEGAPDTLMALLEEPDEVWAANNVQGRDTGKGFSAQITASMGAAFKMHKGKIPKSVWDDSVLGDFGRPTAELKTQPNGARTPVQQNPAVARAGRGEAPRPKRNVKKRSYGDSSFEGYGEGFVDDENQETGYSTGEGDDRAGRKRPKKTSSQHFQGGPLRQNSYGPGMVGV